MSLLTLDIEKPTAGGRMLARRQGHIVLVSGAIPGERVAVRVERTGKGVSFAEVVDVLSASPDRRDVEGDARCGGNVFTHIAYARQLRIKGEIIQDAFGRIARLAISNVPEIVPSPERGYRMRARLHVRDGRIGFFLAGTHSLCDAAATGQLSEGAVEWIARAQGTISTRALSSVTALDLAENAAADERACHLELAPDADPHLYDALSSGLTGLSAQRADRRDAVRLSGTPAVTDVVRAEQHAPGVQLRRDVRAFFQGNRFLLEALVTRVVDLVPGGPVVDLYAGVGLFGLVLAATGRGPVTVVEGDRVSGADLEMNARSLGDRVTVVRCSVEQFLGSSSSRRRGAVFVVDPPRTGLSKEALRGLLQMNPARIIYVSCDVATLARDARAFTETGYRLEHLSGIDLFPNTAHVESIATFTR